MKLRLHAAVLAAGRERSPEEDPIIGSLDYLLDAALEAFPWLHDDLVEPLSKLLPPTVRPDALRPE